MWFEELTGFAEHSPEHVRANLSVEGNHLTSRVNGKSYICGTLETPSLAELRARVQTLGAPTGHLQVREVVANVQQLHADAANVGAVFQVASQFNLLEMVSPAVTPEQGVGIYEHDHTQGPACAIAAGAGTIYRNYFAPVNGQVGQTVDNQIDCLAEVGKALGNDTQHFWKMQNGYALPTAVGLKTIAARLRAASETELDIVRQALRIGVQWHTQVTLPGAAHTVTQVYCSALPVTYSGLPTAQWAEFARLILEAAYEATLCVAVLNAHQTSNPRLYLTLLGGGAFGNAPEWIVPSVLRALSRLAATDLEVALVSYGASNSTVQSVVRQFQAHV